MPPQQRDCGGSHVPALEQIRFCFSTGDGTPVLMCDDFFQRCASFLQEWLFSMLECPVLVQLWFKSVDMNGRLWQGVSQSVNLKYSILLMKNQLLRWILLFHRKIILNPFGEAWV